MANWIADNADLWTGLMVGGAGLESVGSILAGDQQSHSYQKQIELSRWEKKEAKRQTNYKVRLLYEQGAEFLSEQEAETGKSGLAMTGSPLLSLVNNARRVELSASMERRAGDVTAMRYDQQIEALKASQKAAKQSGLMGGLGGIAKIGMAFALAG